MKAEKIINKMCVRSRVSTFPNANRGRSSNGYGTEGEDDCGIEDASIRDLGRGRGRRV